MSSPVRAIAHVCRAVRSLPSFFFAGSCYRNWQGNSCADRTCPFDFAFVDIPHGDLDMSGIVDVDDLLVLLGVGAVQLWVSVPRAIEAIDPVRLERARHTLLHRQVVYYNLGVGTVWAEQIPQLNDLLDVHDPIPWRYTLEVSSPGINRPLLRPPAVALPRRRLRSRKCPAHLRAVGGPRSLCQKRWFP